LMKRQDIWLATDTHRRTRTKNIIHLSTW